MSISKEQVETDDLVLYFKLVTQVNADFCKILLSNKSNYTCEIDKVQLLILQRSYVDFFIKLGFAHATTLKVDIQNIISVINNDIYNSYSKKIDALQSVYADSSILKERIKTLLSGLVDEVPETKKVYTHLLFLLSLKTPPDIDADSKTKEIREKLSALFFQDEPKTSLWTTIKSKVDFTTVIILIVLVILAYLVYMHYSKPKSNSKLESDNLDD